MKFTDPIDQASYLAELHNNSSIAAQRLKNAPQQQKIHATGDDGEFLFNEDGSPMMVWEHTECVECGDQIIEGRLEMAYIRCVDCQSSIEKKEGQYARR